HGRSFDERDGGGLEPDVEVGDPRWDRDLDRGQHPLLEIRSSTVRADLLGVRAPGPGLDPDCRPATGHDGLIGRRAALGSLHHDALLTHQRRQSIIVYWIN